MKSLVSRIGTAFLCAALVLTASGCRPGDSEKESGLLKDVYTSYFPIGAAIKTGYVDMYADLLDNYNSVTFEYEMKWSSLQPEEGLFSYGAADALVDYAVANDKVVRGHALVWYKSVPSWVITEETTKEEALERLRAHIRAVMTYYAEKYGDTVYCWDVVNEALADNPTQEQVESGDFYRTGEEASGALCADWYALCGVDYIKEAFRTADEVRQELGLDIKLYYNDYGLNIPAKREALVKLVTELQEEGIAIDGVGMQAHYYLGDFSMDEFEESIETYTSMGLDVQLTELDISIYPYGESDMVYEELPETLAAIQTTMFDGIFRIAREYSEPKSEGYGSVRGVTMWGVADDLSWLDSTPIANRKNWPLLFDEEHQPKSAYYAVVDFDR